MEKKLAKSNTDRKIFGVCGGIARYFDINSTLVRLITAILVLSWGVGLLVYIAAALIMPNDPGDNDSNKKSERTINVNIKTETTKNVNQKED